MEEVENSGRSLVACAGFFDTHGFGTGFNLSSIFLRLAKLGIGFRWESEAAWTLEDTFLDRAIDFATVNVLRGMKYKARIPVKGPPMFHKRYEVMY